MLESEDGNLIRDFLIKKIGWKDGIAQHERRNGRWTLFERRTRKNAMKSFNCWCWNQHLLLFDEIDSGLDIDFKVVSEGVNAMVGEYGAMIITHYQRLLNYITPRCRPSWWKAV